MGSSGVLLPFDYLLFVTGNMICPPNRFLRILNVLVMFFSTACMIFLIDVSFRTPDFVHPGYTVIQWITDDVYYLIPAFFNLFILFRRSSIRNLYNDIMRTLTVRQFRFIRFLLTVMTVFAVTDTVMTYHTQITKLTEHTPPIEILLADIVASLNNWVPNFTALYVCALTALRFHEQTQMHRMMRKIRREGISSSTVRTVIQMRKQFQYYVSEVNRLLGFAPLVISGYMFLMTPSTLMKLKLCPSQVGTGEIISATVLYSSLLAIVFSVDLLLKSTTELSDQMKELLLSDEKLHPLTQSLVQELSLDRICLTAWGLFDVNRKSLLTFCSAVINFTVLFIQLDIRVSTEDEEEEGPPERMNITASQ